MDFKGVITGSDTEILLCRESEKRIVLFQKIANLSQSQQDEIEIIPAAEVWEDPGKYNLLE